MRPERLDGGGRAVAALAAALLLSACAAPPVAPGPFRDARAVAVAPDGTVWVVEGADGTVLALRGGAVVQRLGGVGTGDDAFLDPADVDPTNGQALFVADRAAGLVVQFTAEGRRAGARVVPDLDGDARRPAGEFGREPRRGQPVAVAAAPDGSVYAVDAGRGHVVKLSGEGTVERVLARGLAEPVDLALTDGGTLFVADAGRGGVQPFDAFGAALPFIEVAGVGRIVGVAVGRAGLLVVGEDGAELQAGGAFPVRIPGAGLRGGAVGDRVLLLTATGVEESALAER